MAQMCHSRDRFVAAWTRLQGEGTLSVALRDASGPVATLNGGVPHYAASTIKLAVLGAWLASGRVNRRGLSPIVQDGTRLRVHADFASAAGGRFELLQADDQDDATWAALGSVVAAETLAARMIQVSGNLAMNLLAEALGLDAVAAYVARLGLGGSIRMGRLIGDASAAAAGITNTVTAAGLATLLAVLADDPGALETLAGQRHRNLIPAGLPAGTWTASKSGWVPGVRHDVALVRPQSGAEYVLSVCTSGLPDEEAEALIREVSRVTYEEWVQWHE